MNIVNSFSTSSSLLRQDGQSFGEIQGYQCWNCGKWIDIEPEIVHKYEGHREKGIDPKAVSQLSISQGIRKLSESDWWMWENKANVYRTMAVAIDMEEATRVILENCPLKKYENRVRASLKRLTTGRLQILMEELDERRRLSESAPAGVEICQKVGRKRKPVPAQGD